MNAKNLLDNGKWKENKMFENKRIPNLKNKIIKVVLSLVSTIIYIIISYIYDRIHKLIPISICCNTKLCLEQPSFDSQSNYKTGLAGSI